jgi:hypothetical protein
LHLLLRAPIRALRRIAIHIGDGTSEAERRRAFGSIQVIEGPTRLRDRLAALLDDLDEAKRPDKVASFLNVLTMLVSRVLRT